MTETLLSASNIILFGRPMADIKIVRPRQEYRGEGRRFKADFGINSHVDLKKPPEEIDGVEVKTGDTILLIRQFSDTASGARPDKWDKENGLYVKAEDGTLKRVEGADTSKNLLDRIVVSVSISDSKMIEESVFYSETDPAKGDKFEIDKDGIQFNRPSKNRRHNPFIADRVGGNRFVEDQLLRKNKPTFARVYGFSYEGKYYELGSPSVFLVHGAGELVSGPNRDPQDVSFAKAPGDPSISGMSASDFQFSDELRAWSYDRADYTIRMDLESGMFEQVLLEPYFGGMGLAGAKLSGAKVSGAKVSGAKVSGAKVSGAKLSGAKLSGDASD